MSEEPKNASGPLPAEWLPGEQPREESREWAAQLARIMAAADAELLQLSPASTVARASAWPVLAKWWKPAAALAAGASALLLLTDREGALREPAAESVSLSLVVSDGDPLLLADAFGSGSHPVLALIAFQGLGTEEESR